MDLENIASITNQWKKGFVDIGKDFKTGQPGGVTASSINYVTKYMFKQFNRKTDKRTPPFSMMSKGRKKTPYGIIGQDYLNQYGTHHIETESLETRDAHGNARRLPKAYLHRLFTNKEDRIELSRKSFEKHINKKLKVFEEKVKKFYDGNVLDYQASISADLERHRENVNNNEII